MTIHPMKYMRDFLARKIRPDGRKLAEVRPTAVNVGSISTADGSALIKIGNTVVICGIKAELTVPNAEKPNEGFVIPNLELPPLCSPQFKSGPPGNTAQVCSQFLADVLANSKCVDLQSLCVVPDKVAWVLYCDLVCLDYDGSVLDACVAALVSALSTVTLPEVKYDPIMKTKCVELEKRKPLVLTCYPFASTFATFDEESILADPSEEEESLSSGTITCVMTGADLCTVHKPGGCRLNEQQVSECISKSQKRWQSLKGMVEASMKSVYSNDF
ncbi:exosome complex component RRP43-like isoform X3 [Neocloeon triangulifer]|uniref:exosome complex component RRP43-like isoform X2 n=1 Tax=Neocloeon triangulifer TaxID=2078957 RepID=UPI00286F5445|nr:exosome complex component RRP43-like isoform X2 [Neocloeon triangulifer]XP_059490617.1 exosome complex component RRP43-like isoform X3 [Neocloeon triangulifer]